MVVEIGHLTIEAVEALVHVDLAAALDGTDGTDGLADPAFRAALRMSLQPVEHAHATENRQSAAERAEEAAVEPLDDEADGDEGKGVGDHRPFGHEAENDGGLKGFHFGAGHGHVPRDKGGGDKAQEEQVLDGDEALMERHGNSDLRDADLPRRHVGQLLERTERTEPAAENGSSPEKETDQREEGEDRDQRIDQEEIPPEVRRHGVDVRDEADDRQLPAGVPSEPDQGPAEE